MTPRLPRARASRPCLAVVIELSLRPVSLVVDGVLDVLEGIGNRWRRFCEDGQRAVDDGCAEYEAGRVEEPVRLCRCEGETNWDRVETGNFICAECDLPVYEGWVMPDAA